MTAVNDIPESLVKAGSALIEYPRFRELHQEILRCQKASKVLGEPHCMSLEGVTGAGKTTLVQAYARSFARAVTQDGDVVPVLYLGIPSPVTIRDLAQYALQRLGDPAFDKGTRAAMTLRLAGLIRDCRVELVILDDFQHLIDTRTNRVLAQVSDWLKVLIKTTNVPFLVVGIEGEVEIVLRANKQLSRLFGSRETLEPFAWDSACDDAIETFSHFVRYVERAVGLPLTQELTRTEMLYRLHYATDGVVGHLMSLMLTTAILATEQGRDILDLPLLSLSFQKKLAKHLGGKADPFAAQTNHRFVSPAPPPGAHLEPW